jgi:hypothetical protein
MRRDWLPLLPGLSHSIPSDHDDDYGGAVGRGSDRCGIRSRGGSPQPLGLVVVGGLLFSQLVTLYLTPVVYTYMAAATARFRKRKQERNLAPAPVET